MVPLRLSLAVLVALASAAQADTLPTGAPGHAGKTARDPSLHIVNRGRRTVTEVHTRPAGSSTWGPDELGSTTIDVQSDQVIPLPAGQCTWDVWIVFQDGPDLERRGLDLCDITDLAVR